MKYYVQVNKQWKAVDRDEANKIMNVKAKRHETQQETQESTVRSSDV